MPKITPRDTLCTDIPRVGTVKTYASRVGIARVLGETISTCTSTILNFGNGKF